MLRPQAALAAEVRVVADLAHHLQALPLNHLYQNLSSLKRRNLHQSLNDADPGLDQHHFRSLLLNRLRNHEEIALQAAVAEREEDGTIIVGDRARADLVLQKNVDVVILVGERIAENEERTDFHVPL